MIPQQPMSFESMGMPEVIREIIQARSGLFLVASPKGGGKTTTANAIIDWYNRNKCKHVIAIENPMEFIHTSKQCLIHQLEITITPDSQQSIGAMLVRMDADAVVLHQMDTPTSVALALALCESGHLVLGMMAGADTQSVLKTLTSAFGLDRVDSIRKALAKHLQGMLAQQLLPRGYSTGRALACEVLVPTQEVRGLIRGGDLETLGEILKNGGDYGMQSMNQSLVELYEKQLVTYNEIFARTTDARDLQTLVRGNEA
jgi:twitching motility protein PilT